MPSLSSSIDIGAERGIPSAESSTVAAFSGPVQFLLWAVFPGHSSPQPLLSFLPKAVSLIVYPQLWHPA